MRTIRAASDGQMARTSSVSIRPAMQGRSLTVRERLGCGLDYARGGGSSGGNVCEGGVNTTSATTREGGPTRTGIARMGVATRAVTHGPIA
jgi:hypothetical protein